MISENPFSVLVCGRYKITSIHTASDATPIFLGKNIQTEEPVQIKSETRLYKHACSNQLYIEGKVLQRLQGGVGIPIMHWGGVDYDYNFLVTERIGPNLKELLEQCNGKFSTKTVLMLALESLSMLQYLHTRNFVHRSINPTSFAVGVGKRSTKLVLVDLVRSKVFVDRKTGRHMPKTQRGFNETNILFSSVTANQGVEASRRDDLESLLYTLIYLSNGGSLPWSNLPEVYYTDTNKQIHRVKSKTTIKQLCKGLPKCLEMMLDNVKGLAFNQKPDYFYLRELVKEEMDRQGFLNDGLYDWLLLPPPVMTVDMIKNGVLPGLQYDVGMTAQQEERFLEQQYQLYLKESTQINVQGILRQQPQQIMIENYEPQKPEKGKDCLIF